MPITSARRRSLFLPRNTVFFIKVNRSHGGKRCVDLPPSASDRRFSFVSSKTTIKSQIPDQASDYAFKLHPDATALWPLFSCSDRGRRCFSKEKSLVRPARSCFSRT